MPWTRGRGARSSWTSEQMPLALPSSGRVATMARRDRMRVLYSSLFDVVLRPLLLTTDTLHDMRTVLPTTRGVMSS